MRPFLMTAVFCLVGSFGAHANEPVGDDLIASQRNILERTTDGKGFGPQSPRDIDAIEGENPRVFETAPAVEAMNLCNIHLHTGAEHKGGEFTTYAGNGNGEGFGTGYQYTGQLSEAELTPIDRSVGAEGEGALEPGDTIEVHYVYSTAMVKPGPTLGSCFNEAIKNPQLRVEAAVFVLVNDETAEDFGELARFEKVGEFFQAVNLPTDMGTPVSYAGSTTGPDYNEKGSPFQVSWSVRPKVKKIDIASLAKWLEDNPFDEKEAHGVRNLVVNPDLLSPIDGTH